MSGCGGDDALVRVVLEAKHSLILVEETKQK